MKKILALFFALLMLCSCSNALAVSTAEVAAAYQGNFTAKVKAVFGGNEAEFTVAKKPESISISATYPCELAGMSIELFDEHAAITYEDMTQDIDTDNLPEGTAFLLLQELFEELADPEDFALSTEKENLRAQNEDFSAVLNSRDFGLISAKFEKYATEFTFSDWNFAAAE